MFDPIPPSRLVAMLGELLRDSARWDRPLDEFRTSQLLSASSVARYLAAELGAAEASRSWFASGVASLVERARTAATEPRWHEALDRAGADLIEGDRPLGEVASDLLRAARAETDPAAEQLARELRGLLAELADRHVDLLAAGGTR